MGPREPYARTQLRMRRGCAPGKVEPRRPEHRVDVQDLARRRDRPSRSRGTKGASLFAGCTEPRCDCRRVILHFVDPRRKRVLASINYAFEPSKPPFEDEPQISLDPLNPQFDQSGLVLRAFEHIIGAEPEHRERFLRHYRLWKSVVDDPRHADHHKVRSVHHDNPSFRPAIPGESFQRVTPKVGANAACPCGSGKKYKRCCRA